MVRTAAKPVVVVAVGNLVCKLVLVWPATRAAERRTARTGGCIFSVCNAQVDEDGNNVMVMAVDEHFGAVRSSYTPPGPYYLPI